VNGKSSLPTAWFRCPECKIRLAPLIVRDGRTAIPIVLFQVIAYIDRADIECPYCGQVRRFTSRPVAEPVKAI